MTDEAATAVGKALTSRLVERGSQQQNLGTPHSKSLTAPASCARPAEVVLSMSGAGGWGAGQPGELDDRKDGAVGCRSTVNSSQNPLQPHSWSLQLHTHALKALRTACCPPHNYSIS
eukprot:1848495-Rhodomonas_salina.1